MITRARIRPSRGASVAGMIVGAMFSVVGIFFVIPATSEHGPAVLFGIAWTVGAIGITAMSAINAFTDRGIGSQIVEIESARASGSSTERLRELEQLRRDGLISEEEFACKRREILAGI